MDWFSWLSKSGLDPSFVHSYALTFTQNELGEDDIAYFNHEILQSMGITTAKHRLEILKLARKTRKHHKSIHPFLRLVVAAKKTKRYLVKHVQALVNREDNSSALAIVPKGNHNQVSGSSRWKAAMLKRSKNRYVAAAAKQERPRPMLTYENPAAAVQGHQKILMLTNGSPLVEHHAWNNNSSFSSPAMFYDEKVVVVDGVAVDGEYWSTDEVPVEDIRWDALFQDLKPT